MFERFVVAVLALALAAMPFAVQAQDEEETEVPKDVEGSRDHPAIKRYPGSIIAEMKELDFEEFNFPVGPEKVEKAEGKYTSLAYYYPAKIGCTQILRNYRNAFQAAKWKTFSGDTWVEGVPDLTYYGERWITSIGDAKGGGKIYVLTNCTEQTPNNPWEGAGGQVVVVETKAMAQEIEVTSDFLAGEIEKNGRVALYGINFATGKADVTPESAKTLEQIGKLLEDKPDWKLQVEGHTDNVGKSAANLELSKKRAAAVKDWLVAEHGVDAKRLKTEGFGDKKPLAPNTTDEGRAKNRRVELVKL